MRPAVIQDTAEGDDSADADVLLRLRGVCFRRDGSTILDGIDLTVARGERWLLLGPNGCGKTTLLRIAALVEHPTAGTVEVLGERLGETDVRVLRRRLGFVSAALVDQLRPSLSAHDVVRTARFGALEPWWHRYSPADDRRAHDCLERLDVDRLSTHAFGTLSSGERTRVLLARSLMNDPAVVLLDEPAAGLDLAGREQLVTTLDDLADDDAAPALVVVTHHVEDVPPSLTHAAVMTSGSVLASGPLVDVLNADLLTTAFGLPLRLEVRPDGRLTAFARR